MNYSPERSTTITTHPPRKYIVSMNNIDNQAAYEAELCRIYGELRSVPNHPNAKELESQIFILKSRRFGYVTSLAQQDYRDNPPNHKLPPPIPEPPFGPIKKKPKASPRRVTAEPVFDVMAPRSFSTKFDRERHEERVERELMRAMSNPFKTNDRKDDMRYQTAGVPNRRGKRRH